MKRQAPITDADLHAYVDDQLNPARRREVEAYLAENPDAATQVTDYLRLDEAIHALYDPVLDKPLPPGMDKRLARHRLITRVAAAVAWVMLGGLLGWFINNELPTQPAPLLKTQLVQPAAFAHYVYTTEVQHPVEVTADQEQHLISWLSKRLHTAIRPPNLAESGYELIGGRLLPSTDRMAAQFMYQNAQGNRVTLYIRRGAWDNQATAFRYARDKNVGIFYWIDGPMGYALSGELDKTQLLGLAQTVYSQLNL